MPVSNAVKSFVKTTIAHLELLFEKMNQQANKNNSYGDEKSNSSFRQYIEDLTEYTTYHLSTAQAKMTEALLNQCSEQELYGILFECRDEIVAALKEANQLIAHDIAKEIFTKTTPPRTPLSLFHPSKEELSLDNYSETKAALESMLGDLSANKIHLIDRTGKPVFFKEYRELLKKSTKYTEEDERIEYILEGTIKRFRPDYDKKTNTYTNNTLFIPKFQAYTPPITDNPQPKIKDVIDLNGYLDTKYQLQSIFRDFTDKKIHFITPDEKPVFLEEYRRIASFTKEGQDPALFLKGVCKKFKTGYNRKTNMFTENALFIPEFKQCDPNMTPDSPPKKANLSMLRAALPHNLPNPLLQATTKPQMYSMYQPYQENNKSSNATTQQMHGYK